MFGFRRNKPKMFVTEPIQMCPAEYEALLQQAQYAQEMAAQQQQEGGGGGSGRKCKQPQTVQIPIDYNWTPSAHHHHHQYHQYHQPQQQQTYMPQLPYMAADYSCGYGNYMPY